MSFIRTNLQASLVARRLAQTNREFGITLERLTTGLRINRPEDDPGGFGVVSNQSMRIRGIDQGITNVQNAASLLQTAEEGVFQIHGILDRAHELAVSASNTNASEADRRAFQVEIDGLLGGITDIVANADFNGVKLLSDRLSQASLNGGALPSSTNITITDSTGATKEGTATWNFDGTTPQTVKTILHLDVAIDNEELGINTLGVNVTDASPTVLAEKIEDAIEAALGGDFVAGGRKHISVTANITAGGGAAGADLVKFQFATDTTGTNVSLFVDSDTVAGDAGSVKIFTAPDTVSGGTGNDKLKIRVDGELIEADLSAGTGIAGTTIADSLETAINNAKKFVDGVNVSFTTSGSSGFLTISSLSKGNSSSIEIVDGSGDILTVLNLTKNDPSTTTDDPLSIARGQGSSFDFVLGSGSDIFEFTIDTMGLTNLGGVAGSSDPLAQGINVSEVNVEGTTPNNAQQAATTLQSAIEAVSRSEIRLGAAISNLQRRSQILESHQENLTEARALVQEIDFTKETQEFTKLQILIQSGTAVLAQANLVPQTLLTLLGG